MNLGPLMHAVSRPKEGEDWQYSTGYINEDMIRERLFPAGPTTFAGICGPPAMVNAACLPNLQVCSQALAAPLSAYAVVPRVCDRSPEGT
jgi:Oxidoreductase NAD-binding domain